MEIWGRCKKCNEEFLKEYLNAHEATCNGKAHLKFSFKPEEVKPEKSNYDRYWVTFMEDQVVSYIMEELKTAEVKGDKANYLDQLINMAKAYNFPKLAEKAIIRRLKRRAK